MLLFEKARPRITVESVDMLEACMEVNGLVQALSARDSEVVKKAVEALKRIGSPAVDPLIQLCNSKDRGLQLKAAIILGHIKSKKAAPALVQLSYIPDVDVRACACLSLGPIDDDRAISPLIYHMADEDQDVRDAAAFSLSVMGDRVIVPVVASLARSNQQLQDTSDTLERANELGNFDAAILARHVLYRNHLENLQDGVVKLISYADKPRIKSLLRYMYANERARGVDVAISKSCSDRTLDVLLGMAYSESDDVIVRVAASLGAIRDQRARRPLEYLLNDDSRAVREAAAAALRNITQTGVLDVRKEKDPTERRVTLTFECDHCRVPVECGSYYCPACGALFFDTSKVV